MNYQSEADRRALYGKPIKLNRAQPLIVDPNSHSMREDNFVKYIGRYQQDNLNLDNKKFSPLQSNMLAHSYSNGYRIHVIGAYKKDFRYLLEECNFSLIGDLVEHDKSKLFNCRRQAMGYVDTNGDGNPDELWVIVFPSAEYVDQIAELIGAILEDYRVARPPVIDGACVEVSHFPILEACISQWTDFNDFSSLFIRNGDVVVLGNVEWILEGLKDYAFLTWTNMRDQGQIESLFEFGGLDDMFGIHIAINKYSYSRLVIIGIKESFWGSASALYVKSLLESGVKHILYASKAASIVNQDQVHKIYVPDSFSIIDSNGKFEKINHFETNISDLIHNLGINKVGLSITVPTVIGESGKQRTLVGQPGGTCMDCENGHIAKVICNYNLEVGRKGDHLTSKSFEASFLPVHFITDYIYREKEPPNSEVPGLGHHAGNSELVDGKRRESFRKIGNVFGAYALAFGIKDVRSYIKSIHRSPDEPTFIDEFRPVKDLLDVGLGREALSHLASGTDNKDYRIVSAMAYLMTCQKSGYIDAAFHCLKKLKSPDVWRRLTEIEVVRILTLEFKIWSQIGSGGRLSNIVKFLDDPHNAKQVIEIDQYGAMKRREAIYHAINGRFDSALISIGEASRSELKPDSREHQVNVYFDLLSRLPYAQTPLKDVSAKLSNVRKVYLEENKSQGLFQTNFEKSALAALFLEATFYLSSKYNENVKRGIKILTIAHLLNLRLNGGVLSEGYGEIVACTKDHRVKNIISLAMRTDQFAQSAFQGRVGSDSNLLSKIAGGVSQILKHSISEREGKILELLSIPS